MKLRLLAATLAALTFTAGTALAQDTSSSKGQLSYALGYQFGNQLVSSEEPLDINAVIKAVQDGYAKKQPTVPVEQMKTAYQAMMGRMETKAKAAFDKASAENKSKSDAFLAQNRTKPGVKTLPSGVQYRVMEAGNGAKPTLASTVDLEVSTPYPLGQHPAQVQPPQKTPNMKISQIPMPAIREVLMQMPAGSKWEIAVPSAFGSDPRSDMPPNLAAVYEVKLLSVK